jgi:hypothetical protein
MEGKTMAALIKRFLKNGRKKPYTTWAYREERQQFERELDRWKTGQWN